MGFRNRVLSILTPSILMLSLPLSGCGDSEEGAYQWEVEVTAITDLCNPAPVGYQETFTYSLYFNGSATDLRIEGESFATGEISGCSLTYASPIIGETRGDPDSSIWVKWQLEGEATIRQGGSACELEDGLDWEGTEVFEILSSDDTGLEEGCTYTMEVKGTYLGHDG